MPEYEVNGTSRISKLWVQRIEDKREVYNWDRGIDRPAEDAQVAAVVERICAELAERIFNPAPTTEAATNDLDAVFTQIAKEHLFIETLVTRNSDALDFHDVSVAGVRRALAAAYAAGQASKEIK